LYLLFAKGKRPDRAAILTFTDYASAVTLSHDPSRDQPADLAPAGEGGVAQQDRPQEAPAREFVWVELLRDGLAFDLLGLAPGTAPQVGAVDHRFDLEQSFDPQQHDALQLKSGHHLVGGERTIPVTKGLVGLARDIVDHFEDCRAVFWPAASSAIGQQFFESTASAWLDGGPFPALGLTAFRETMDGALQSEGLEFFIGQELRIEPPLSHDKVAATRLAVRLVNQLVLVGGIESSERVVAPDSARLILRTSRNGKFVRVWRE
jgi:hypothetical protein